MEVIKRQEDTLLSQISQLIEQSRTHVKKAVNTAMVKTYFEIGRYIVEFEQDGMRRAAYGAALLKELSTQLTAKYGKGWSEETLKKCRKFYSTYSHKNTAIQTDTNLVYSVDQIQNNTNNFCLSWNHYLILMRIENPDARQFYEIEAKSQDWSVRQLRRQVGSSLYERLALSRDKKEVMRLANEGQTIEKPSDLIKDPITLEFLGLRPDAIYSESKLENAIIDKLQAFLLELGKGFLFEARQKRFTFDEEHFFVDLVFYNRLLQCYVLIDLKTGRLTHQDLGQMQMYVNYFDRNIKQEFEKPTIGILLCENKSDALVELTLPKDANIFASSYQLYLPDKQLLQAKVREWIQEFKESEGNQTER